MAFRTKGPLDVVVACHCDTCQRLSGSHVYATRIKYNNLEITSDAGLHWYRSSPLVKRGFCQYCGSNLFYRADDSPNISIHAGTFHNRDGLKLDRHIFVSEKPDYYSLHDDLPKFPHAD
ncbi:MAG: GFA family protein [Pseudomonadota bacterium]